MDIPVVLLLTFICIVLIVDADTGMSQRKETIELLQKILDTGKEKK